MNLDSSTVYRKHHSFAQMRHRAPVDDVMARIRAVQARLPEIDLADDARSVVEQACRELIEQRGPSATDAPFTLHSYVIEEISRLSDEQLPRYLWYRFRYEVYPQRKRLDQFPPCLQVEPTSVCNYRCVFCYQTDRSFTQRANGHMGMMSLETFQRVVDEAQGRCEALTLASRGEPLICPDLEAMLRYASGKFLALKMNTNAWYLDEPRCHAILQADFNTLVFSADAASEPSYSQLRRGGTLERVRANIARFRDIRQKHYPHARLITRVSGVQVPGTPDVEDMERFWGALVDQVAFVTYNPWENTYERPINDVQTACSDLWRRMFVWWDGTVNPCDVDYQSTLAVGKVHATTLRALWRSDAYERLRAAHLAKQRARCSPCNRCTVV